MSSPNHLWRNGIIICLDQDSLLEVLKYFCCWDCSEVIYDQLCFFDRWEENPLEKFHSKIQVRRGGEQLHL
jgi:hypothetical protein